MKYITYLKNKNLSKTTIDIYLKEYNMWNCYLNGTNPTKSKFVKYVKNKSDKLSPNTIRQRYSSVLSILRYEKRYKLLNECMDIKLPSIQKVNRLVISLPEYNEISKCVDTNYNWYGKRNWLIFACLFYTGIRVSELSQIKISAINNNQLVICGKGKKHRTIYFPDFLVEKLKEWKYNFIITTPNGKKITYKQIACAVSEIGQKYFNKKITPHSLRRSYATNLIRNDVNIKVVSELMGHSNINTTSRYIWLNSSEIMSEVERVLG